MVVQINSQTSGKAVSKYIRISPRKVRLVLDAIRRQPIDEAFSRLAHLSKKGATIVSKVLKSAVANAKVKKLDENRLFVRLAFADGGPTLKRHLPRAMGRADTILKRTSHITVVVEEGLERNLKADSQNFEKGSQTSKVIKKGKKKEAASAA